MEINKHIYQDDNTCAAFRKHSPTSRRGFPKNRNKITLQCKIQNGAYKKTLLCASLKSEAQS